MSREFRIMLLSEKSGRNYSLKLRLAPLGLLFVGLISLILFAVYSGFIYFRGVSQQISHESRIVELEEEIDMLVQLNQEAQLFKKWADGIIYRRYHYAHPDGDDRQTPVTELLNGDVPADVLKGPAAPPVDIDAFTVRRFNLELDFEVGFKLVNRTPGRKKTSGYLHIIATHDAIQPAIYSSWPPCELTSGLPGDYTCGSPFSIRYLKQVTGRIDQPPIGPKYNRVDIIAYDDDGALILKRGFYIERQLQQTPYE